MLRVILQQLRHAIVVFLFLFQLLLLFEVVINTVESALDLKVLTQLRELLLLVATLTWWRISNFLELLNSLNDLTFLILVGRGIVNIELDAQYFLYGADLRITLRTRRMRLMLPLLAVISVGTGTRRSARC